MLPMEETPVVTDAVSEFVARHGGPAVRWGSRHLCADGAYWMSDGYGLQFHAPPENAVGRAMLQLRYQRSRLTQVDSAWQHWQRIPGPYAMAFFPPTWNDRALGPAPEKGQELERLRELYAERQAKITELIALLRKIHARLEV